MTITVSGPTSTAISARGRPDEPLLFRRLLFYFVLVLGAGDSAQGYSAGSATITVIGPILAGTTGESYSPQPEFTFSADSDPVSPQ